MAGGSKKNYREPAQVAAAFGSLPAEVWTDYRVFVGFWLNFPRARLFRLPAGRSAAYWDAIAFDEAEGGRLAREAAKQQLMAALKGRRR